MTHPEWIKETVLEMYMQGKSSRQIEALTGITKSTVYQWCKEAGISRSLSEALLGHRPSLKTRQKASQALKGRCGKHSNHWKGDNAGKRAQHNRAEKDYPLPLGICELYGKKRATDRMRMDHTLLPYLPELVILACRPCNKKHDSGTVSITFLSPYDGKWYCAIKEDGKARLLEVS